VRAFSERVCDMITRNLSRRLERLEAELAPMSDEPVLTIHLTCVGQQDRIIAVHGTEPPDRRRRPWPRAWSGGRGR
jgi:hypothetical protein